MWNVSVDIEKVLRLPNKELKALLRILRKQGLVAQA
jgi:hypothetical protein